MMNPIISEALEYCKQTEHKKFILAVPFPIDEQEIQNLLMQPNCNGLILLSSSLLCTNEHVRKKISLLPNLSQWKLPPVSGVIVLTGSQRLLTQQMIHQLLLHLRHRIICKTDESYQDISVYRLFWHLSLRQFRSILYKCIEKKSFGAVKAFLQEFPLIKKIWRLFFSMSDHTTSLTSHHNQRAQNPYRDFLKEAHKIVLSSAPSHVPGSVLHVNTGLAAGGTERQIVNTLTALRDSKKFNNIIFLAEHINQVMHLDFFLSPLLTPKTIQIISVRHSIRLWEHGFSNIPASIAHQLTCFDEEWCESILNLVEEFRTHRPQILHSWQDETNIRAGFAAIITGIPRIILATRNLAPFHFNYHWDFMRAAYQALATFDHVKFTNNSLAGASDYAKWLDLPIEKFSVIKNGVDLNNLICSSHEEVTQYRKSLSIPPHALLVGSIFRFSSEKRPLLWLDTAEEILKLRPETHFILAGEGPMSQQIKKTLKRKNLNSQIHLLGLQKNVALILSTLDLFLLTSQFEGTPNAILEAQAMGVPVVSTDAGGVQETLRNNITGRIATDNPKEIARLVVEFLENKHALLSARDFGPPWIASEFGIDSLLEATLKIYGVQ